MTFNAVSAIVSLVPGGIAQLGERLNGIQEVSGSIPLISTRTIGAAGSPLDVREVTSSSLVSSTKRTTPKGVVLFIYSFLYSVVFPDPQGVRQLFKDHLATDLQ